MDRRIKKNINRPLQTILDASSELIQPALRNCDRLMVRRNLNSLIQSCITLQAILDEDELEHDRRPAPR